MSIWFDVHLKSVLLGLHAVLVVLRRAYLVVIHQPSAPGPCVYVLVVFSGAHIGRGAGEGQASAA